MKAPMKMPMKSGVIGSAVADDEATEAKYGINDNEAAEAQDEAGEDPKEEATENPAQESAEDAQEPDEQGNDPMAGKRPGDKAPPPKELTPEEEEEADWGSEQALKAITGDDQVKILVAKLKASDDTAMAAGETTANLVKSVMNGTEQQFGKELSQSVLYNMGAVVAEHIANICQAAGLINPDVKSLQAFFGQVLTHAIDYFTGKAQETLKDQRTQATGQQMAQQGQQPQDQAPQSPQPPQDQPPPPAAPQGIVGGAMTGA